jgi:endonuclease YncB( thermonuclease family)
MRLKALYSRESYVASLIGMLIIVLVFGGCVATYVRLYNIHNTLEPEALMTTAEWPAATYYKLRNVRVVDGDTLEADIDLPMRVTLRQEMIRCAGYDAWEANKRRRSVNVTDEEVTKGKAATEALKSLIASGQLMVQLEEDDRDVYGRVLARLYVARDAELVSVADWMIANEHTRREQ